MSAIWFNSKGACDVYVRGSERAWFGVYCSGLMVRVLKHTMRDSGSFPSVWRRILKDTYICNYKQDGPLGTFEEVLSTWLTTSFNNKFVVGDVEIDPFCVALNTAIVSGSDPIVLAARLHGQSEIHTYVEGENRAWLADVIRRGRKIGFLRKDMGWESVVQLLELDSDSPIVASYSVTESFPNRHIAGWDDASEDSWYNLTYARQWNDAISGLRDNSDGLEMTPLNWNEFSFRDGINAFQLAEMVEEYRKE